MKIIRDPITASTAAAILQRSYATAHTYADKGLIGSHRLPNGYRIFERADCERVARERAEREARRDVIAIIE